MDNVEDGFPPAIERLERLSRFLTRQVISPDWKTH